MQQFEDGRSAIQEQCCYADSYKFGGTSRTEILVQTIGRLGVVEAKLVDAMRYELIASQPEPCSNEILNIGDSLRGFVSSRSHNQTLFFESRHCSMLHQTKAVTDQENIPFHELIQAPDRTRSGLQPALMRTVLLRFAPLPAPLL